jgi:hypothetical protein
MANKPFDPTLKSMVEVGPVDWTILATFSLGAGTGGRGPSVQTAVLSYWCE